MDLAPPIVLLNARIELVSEGVLTVAFDFGVPSAGLAGLADLADARRLAARSAERSERSELGQFLTPAPVAEFMASLFGRIRGAVRLLDAGAGVGSLTAAFVAEAARRDVQPRTIDAVSYEIDDAMLAALRSTLRDCEAAATRSSFSVTSNVIARDFISAAVEQLDVGLFSQGSGRTYTHAILNPPYKKLQSDSSARLALRRVGIETSNLYAAFIGLAVLLLEPGGELVAITPRSFCNGPYFRPFRELFLREMTLRRIHLFDSRTEAFADDSVLQEIVVVHAVKKGAPSRVVVSSSDGPDDEWIAMREVEFNEIVQPGDAERFIHVVPDAAGDQVADVIARLPATLEGLGINVSTGKVVDFRAKEHLRADPARGALPLIYPTHFDTGSITWPKAGKKPNALADVPATAELWMPSGTYVLVKRFSSKEEKRRVVAAVFDPVCVPAERIGFENHLNVFHERGAGLEPALACGLSVYLNSTLLDERFRQFNGHTQVNATDLRSLRYPDSATLRKLGARAAGLPHNQVAIDTLVEEVLGVSKKKSPVGAKRKLDEALSVLRTLGMPRQQQNDRSALTLLALLGLMPSTRWSNATAPLMGITPVLEFIAEHYGKTYAPNTRETVRRQTMHQFLDAGLVIANPDEPNRAINSAKNVYQIEAKALDLFRAFGTDSWQKHLENYLGERETLAKKYAQERAMARLPVRMPSV